MQRIITNTTRRVVMGGRRCTAPSPVAQPITGARRVHSIARTGAIVSSAARTMMTVAGVGAAVTTAALWMNQHETVAKAAPREHESQEEDTYVREPKNDDELRRLLQSGKDVFLEIYDEECVNCALLGGILRQTSFAVSEVPGLVIAKVNDKIPAVRSLLSAEEMEVRPFIALHLATGQRVVYQHDARGVQELLQFIHEHGRNKFNMKQALNTAARFEASTQRILHRIVAENIPKEQKADVTLRLHMGAPCGDQLVALYTALALAPYREDLMPLARAKVAMAECESSRVPQRIEYWARINDVAQKELASMPPILMNVEGTNTNTAVAQQIVAAASPPAGAAKSAAKPTTKETKTESSETAAEERSDSDNAAVHQLKFWTQVANTSEKELKSAMAARDAPPSSSPSDAAPATQAPPAKLKPKIK